METEHNKPYEFHGLELRPAGSQWKTTCPFCDKPKLYISKKTGQYNCKACSKSGNKFTFLTEYYKSIPSSLRERRKISEIRGIPVSIVGRQDLKFSESGEVLIPINNPDKKNLVNLRKWSPQTKKAYNTPGCCSLYFLKWETEGPIYICEGEWDAMALGALMERAKWSKIDQASIVAVPGANIFKDTWLPYFKDRQVCLISVSYTHLTLPTKA